MSFGRRAGQLVVLREMDNGFTSLPSRPGAKLLRYTEFDAQHQSNTIRFPENRPDRQQRTVRRGPRNAVATLRSGLLLTDYEELFANSLQRDFTNGPTFSASGGDGIIVHADGFTRTTGSWTDDDFLVGQTIRAEGLADAANNGRPLPITGFYNAGQRVYVETFGTPLTANGTPDTACTVNAEGQLSYIPDGVSELHTEDRWCIEEHDRHRNQSYLNLGLAVTGFEYQAPGEDILPLTFNFIGRERRLMTESLSPYFSAPADYADSEARASLDVLTRIGAQSGLYVRNLTFSLQIRHVFDRVHNQDFPVVLLPDQFTISGTLDVLANNESVEFIEQAYADETEFPIFHVVRQVEATTTEFFSFFAPRAKFMQPQLVKQVGEYVQVPFEMLVKPTSEASAANTLRTSLAIQDSTL